MKHNRNGKKKYSKQIEGGKNAEGRRQLSDQYQKWETYE